MPPFGQRDEHLGGDRLRVAAQFARIADAHRVALAAFDRRRHRFGAERGGDHVLHVGDHQAVARQLRAIGLDIEIIAADDAFGEGAGRARHRAHGRLDLARDLLHLGEIGAVTL